MDPDSTTQAAPRPAPSAAEQEARALVAAATPGPWQAVNYPRGSSSYFLRREADTYCEDEGPIADDCGQADAALIARAPDLLLALADECEGLRAQRDAAETGSELFEAAAMLQAERDQAREQLGLTNEALAACQSESAGTIHRLEWELSALRGAR